MRLNRRMERYLADLRSREVDAQVQMPGKGPDVGVVEAGGCFLLRGFAKKPHLSPADFPDPTGLECSANKLLMEGMFDAHLIDSCPLLLLTAGLITARALSGELSRHPGRFNVILSYDGDSCAVRFHKIRAGQRWLADDLEGYVDEGVLVFEAGAEQPLPALLTG
ncbi:MAG TPA: hypothetical protein VLW85_25400 [Myxococcales bacterium]|nr:hypothetical protein [Myxococcales bacterium]